MHVAEHLIRTGRRPTGARFGSDTSVCVVSLTKRMPTQSGHDLLKPAIRYGPSVRNPPRHIVAPVHHDAVMLGCAVRTTIDLPDDLHKQAQAIARDTHRTLSETVADLVRRGLRAGSTTALSKIPGRVCRS